ncbi:Uncharacterised protein [Bordetella pertussis]|nr:Uncharacterised protein [Bordetella pertussis]CFW10458.1 Uncharacterised protein [Bordetella pertussis]CPJ47603.1 Uncharacterised protein [Bordetella pertussis]CPO57696.1 Uncharacterised protein [Bordetella pertussis]
MRCVGNGTSSACRMVGTMSTPSTSLSLTVPRTASPAGLGSMTMSGTRCTVS